MTKDYYSDFTEEKYSKSDFTALLVRRIKKDLRNNVALDMKQNYVLFENEPITQIIAKLIEMMFENRLDLVIVENNFKLEGDLIVFDDSHLEKYVSKRLNVFFKKKGVDNLKSAAIPIIRTITYAELNQLKEIFEIDGEIEKESLEFVDKLNEKYSQTKTSFLKSFNYISKIL